MARFIINRGTESERTVEADDYNQRGSYFEFQKWQAEGCSEVIVATLASRMVDSVERLPDDESNGEEASTGDL